jgi:hypothetical protein
MYQPLIWVRVVRNDASRLLPAAHSQDVERLADALIHRVRGDVELGRDFLRRQMLVDQPQAVELPGTQARDQLSHGILPSALVRFVRGGNHAGIILQRKNNPPQHCRYSEQRVQVLYDKRSGLSRNSADFEEIW